MTYKEESYVLNNIRMIQDVITSPVIKQHIKETHENNVMLKQIISILNHYLANHNRENADDFGRNVLANLISSSFDINNFIK